MPPKKGKGKLPLFRGNGERVNPIYALQTFHVPPLHIQGGGGPRGDGAAAPLLIGRNVHTRGAGHKAQEGGALRQKYPDEVEEAGCGDCGQVFGGNVQPNRGGIDGIYPFSVTTK